LPCLSSHETHQILRRARHGPGDGV
jgi:hypothetical protein